jgi:hypothetical protein
MNNVIDFLQNKLDKAIAMQFIEVENDNRTIHGDDDVSSVPLEKDIVIKYHFGQYYTKPRVKDINGEIKVKDEQVKSEIYINSS